MNKVYLYKIRINNGGYADSGQYFGIGDPVYCMEYFESGEKKFIRAKTRNEAKEKLSLVYYPVKFIRE